MKSYRRRSLYDFLFLEAMEKTAKTDSFVGRFLKGVAREILVPVALALIVIQYVIQAFQIPSGSMEDTLLVGDFLLGLKFVYGSPIPFSDEKFPALTTPERGDVVIFRYPGEPEYPDYDSKRYTHLVNALMFGNLYWDSEPENGNPHLVHYADGPKDFIKRCVALSGDTIEIKEGRFYLNGKEQKNLPGYGKFTATYRSFSPRDHVAKVRLPMPQDTLHLDSLSLYELWRIRSLIVQENPDVKVELDLHLSINGLPADNFVFDNFKVPVESDRGLLLNTVLANRQAVGISLQQGDTLEGPVSFAFFSSFARTGFLPMIDPRKKFEGFTRQVSYMNFEGTQLQDLENHVKTLNTAKPVSDSLSNDSLNADTLVSADVYDLKYQILFDGKPITKYVVQAPVYFMMGDNRDNSADSRYWGMVATRNIKAKAFVIYFSFENSDGTFALNKPFTWWRIPFKIRWTRLGKVIHLIGK